MATRALAWPETTDELMLSLISSHLPGRLPHLLLCGMVLVSAGCASTETDGSEADNGDELRPVRAFTIPTRNTVVSNEVDEAPLMIRAVDAPNISALNRPDYDLAEKGYDPDKEPIKVELLNTWDDGGRYYANVRFHNPGRQILKTIFIFGYDRLGRLVTTRSDQTFFRAKANIVRTLNFKKSDTAVRWTVLVKN